MKPGRNDPCPCGSGKKFKKCCINASPPISGPDISTIELNKLTAYEGKVGRERKEWCERFISWKKEQLKILTARQKIIEESTGNRISCSKGCWYCCSQHVGASLQECDAIVYWLYQRDDILESFLYRYRNWRNRIRKHENVFQQVAQAGSMSLSHPDDEKSHKLFIQKAEVYGQLNILCPFLQNGICSIYPVRPFVCAIQIVTSPPENCKPSVDKTPDVILGAPSPALQPSYFRGPENNLVFSPAPLIVFEIINGGYIYLNDIPGLNGLENEAFNDPKIRSLLKRAFKH